MNTPTVMRPRARGRGFGRLTVAAALVLVPSTLRAAKPAPAAPLPAPAVLTVEPARMTLANRWCQEQLLLGGKDSAGNRIDFTHHAVYWSDNPAVAAVTPSGLVAGKADGRTVIHAQVAGRAVAVPVVVRDLERRQPLVFSTDIVAVLNKAGCNQGSCHGNASGKAGFRLSLRGYDPALDYESLTHDVFGRRTNPADPGRSLILMKATTRVKHEGGLRFPIDSAEFRTLAEWIGSGRPGDPPHAPTLQRIEVRPGRRVISAPARDQQLAVRAFFSGGASRDVTTIAVYSSSDETIAKVSPDGFVRASQAGDVAVAVHYLDKMVAVRLTFVPDVPNFVWKAPPDRNLIDHHVFAKLRQMRILPSGLCTDAEFIRRAYLDALGILPAPAEVQQFLADRSPDRRAALIDRLVGNPAKAIPARPEYADFWTLKWADLLRNNRTALQLKGVSGFQHWIHASVERNKPFDQFARELITGLGSTYANPPANFYRVSFDKASTMTTAQNCAETTAQLFLGVRLQCAKCHNHPFERWTQDDYYSLAAFFARIRAKDGLEAGEQVIWLDRRGEITQPRSGRQMTPRVLGTGSAGSAPSGPDRLGLLAELVTAKTNPFFAKTAVNRVWYQLMGRGIVHPVDDFRDSNPPSNEELLNALAADFVAHGYDVQDLIRTIMNSTTYQLSSQPNASNRDDEIQFSHARVRRLTAEQLLDAISTLTGAAEKFPGLPAGTRATQLPDGKVNNYFLQTFGQPNREMACECERGNDSNLSQALQLINGGVVSEKLHSPTGRIQRLAGSRMTDIAIVRELYLSALSRPPAASELEATTEHIRASKDRRRAIEDVTWAIINCKEFLFQH